MNQSGCGACGKPIERRASLRCTVCQGGYHFQCLNMNKSQYSALPESYRSKWVCPTCTTSTKRHRTGINTPVQQQFVPTSGQSLSSDNMVSDELTVEPLTGCADDVDSDILMPKVDSTDAITMDKMSVLFDDKMNIALASFAQTFRLAIKEDIREMVRSEMNGVVETLKDEFTKTTDFICDEQKDLNDMLEEKEKRIAFLEEENLHVKSRLVKLESRLTSIEKISRNCNLEIQAVPERSNENVMALFKNLCETVNCGIEESNVIACRRVAKINASSKRPRNILISFSNSRLRDNILSAVHRYNKSHRDHPLLSTDLRIPGEPSKIYIAEHLSPEQKLLHAATRKKGKELMFKYVWVKNGQIYARKDDTTSAILIRDMTSVDDLH